MYRKHYEVIGYAYEADLHCLDCAANRWGEAVYKLDFTAIDGEGNPVHPVFLGDEYDTPPVCGDCHQRLDGEEDTPEEEEGEEV
jgi:hypothetical protein